MISIVVVFDLKSLISHLCFAHTSTFVSVAYASWTSCVIEKPRRTRNSKASHGARWDSDERLSKKPRSARWTEEEDKEDALTRAVTFLEDALGYRWAVLL